MKIFKILLCLVLLILIPPHVVVNSQLYDPGIRSITLENGKFILNPPIHKDSYSFEKRDVQMKFEYEHNRLDPGIRSIEMENGKLLVIQDSPMGVEPRKFLGTQTRGISGEPIADPSKKKYPTP